MTFRKTGVFVFLCVCCGFASIPSVRAAEGDTSDWSNYTDYVVIDHDTTWNGRMTRAEIPLPVVVVNEATLTIEKGADVAIDQLSVYNGRIVAEGTVTEPIHITKQADDESRVPAEYAPYDRECYLGHAMGIIEFYTDAANEPSVFRNVTFEGMGMNATVGSDNCPWNISWSSPVGDWLVPTVRAADLMSNPALRLYYGKVSIEHSTFRNNATADIETELEFSDDWDSFDSLSVTETNFVGNAQDIALISTFGYDGARDFSGRVHLKNNWYGSSSGPTIIINPLGTGERLIGKFWLDGWSATVFSSACTEQCYSNVLFLPGLEASQLSVLDGGGVGDRVWVPHSNSDATKLQLDEHGKSVDDGVVASGVVENAYVPIKGNIYASFVEEMDRMKDTEHLITDWKAIPYDWRLSLDDIVNHGEEKSGGISYTRSPSTSYIVEELKRLASTSKSGKVTIVAHSNGGLVAKELIRQLGDVEATRLIDKVVLVAVPQTGTPQAIGAILHGYQQGLIKDWMPLFLSPQAARRMANNMPGAYHLLPSEAYFTGEGSGVQTPVISFRDNGAATRSFIGTYGETIDSADELSGFLAENEGKASPDTDDLVSPSTVNTGLLTYAKETHRALDTLAIPESIAVYEIAGFGEETLGTIRYETETDCVIATNDGRCVQSEQKLAYTPEVFLSGDGTVLAPSAIAMSTEAPNVKRYWVNLQKYDSFFNLEREHADILEVPGLRDLITKKILTGLSTTLPTYISDSEPSIDSTKRLDYYLHSPLALSARDSDGHIISASASEIPGARYRRFGEVQYLSLPADSHPTVILAGDEAGSFTLEARTVEGDTVTATATFSGIPSTAQTEATMSFSDGTIEHAAPLQIDYDGDGTNERTLAPVVNGTVTLEADVVPPVTVATPSGSAGLDGWYTNDVTVALAATDTGSGVNETKYRLDDSTEWLTYSEPIAVVKEGETRISFFSTDQEGNEETPQNITLKGDKTAPEASIAFDPLTQKFAITGTDNLSQNVAVTMLAKPEMSPTDKKIKPIKPWFSRWFQKHRQHLPDLLATLSDDAGHTTSLAFEKTRDRNGYLFVRVQSIGYDESESIPAEAAAQYKWQVDRKSQYRLFATHLGTASASIESHYIPRKNETWIMERPGDLADDIGDDGSESRPVLKKLPGMLAPYMETAKGRVQVKY